MRDHRWAFVATASSDQFIAYSATATACPEDAALWMYWQPSAARFVQGTFELRCANGEDANDEHVSSIVGGSTLDVASSQSANGTETLLGDDGHIIDAGVPFLDLSGLSSTNVTIPKRRRRKRLKGHYELVQARASAVTNSNRTSSTHHSKRRAALRKPSKVAPPGARTSIQHQSSRQLVLDDRAATVMVAALLLNSSCLLMCCLTMLYYRFSAGRHSSEYKRRMQRRRLKEAELVPDAKYFSDTSDYGFISVVEMDRGPDGDGSTNRPPASNTDEKVSSARRGVHVYQSPHLVRPQGRAGLP